MADPENRPIGFEMMEAGMAVSPQPPPPEELIYPPVGQNMDTSPLVSGNIQPIGFEDQVNPAFRDDVPSQRAKGHVSFSGVSSRALIFPGDQNGVTLIGVKTLVTEIDVTDEGNTNGHPKTKIAKDGTESFIPYVDGVDDNEDIVLLRNFEQQQQRHGSNSFKIPAVETLYFRDGVKRIDFVLAYNDTDADKKVNRRNLFEENLKKEGVELEYEERHRNKKDKLRFVKIHCPWEVLISYAEVMSMKMPLAMNDLDEETTSCWSKCPTPFDLDEEYLPPVPDYFTAAFSRNRLDKFIVDNKETFFSSAQRGLIAYQVLSRCTYEEASDKRKRKFGIKNLINSGVYQAAYPLHEGEYLSPHSLLTRGKSNDRHLLYETWAKPGRWYKYQPLDHIRKYFGEKIGIYFAWLGYYTALLLPAALIGLVVFIYGCVRLFDDTVGKEICDENGVGNFTMCPLCDVRCTFWKLKKSCTYSRATYIFDNEATVFFAGFMALWATFFHEMWKRKQAEIEYDWDVADFEQEENIRPEYEAQVSTTKKNPINQARSLLLLEMEEPHVRFAHRVCRFASSFITVVFMLCLVVAAAFGVIVYRVTVAAIFYSVDQEEISARANLITTITAAIINLIIIVILSWVYLQIATFLTNFEMPRTETEWEDSFTFKMFLFQFINHYSSIFYIAFFKGRFIGRPGAYNRQINFTRQEECDPADCLIELCFCIFLV
ncbi:anoctamin-4-like [Patella vulgata]|uniref:anoctamin-4-like n=1 Tax=Patella vulgata TaxID=6465 RepID=UPI0024A9EC35|nr:anoctamin-4-like [Patella vulgata]